MQVSNSDGQHALVLCKVNLRNPGQCEQVVDRRVIRGRAVAVRKANDVARAEDPRSPLLTEVPLHLTVLHPARHRLEDPGDHAGLDVLAVLKDGLAESDVAVECAVQRTVGVHVDLVIVAGRLAERLDELVRRAANDNQLDVGVDEVGFGNVGQVVNVFLAYVAEKVTNQNEDGFLISINVTNSHFGAFFIVKFKIFNALEIQAQFWLCSSRHRDIFMCI